MVFTQGHFEIVARVIRETEIDNRPHNADKFERDIGANNARDQIARDLANEFGNGNERFDRLRFLKACDVQSVRP